MRPKIEVERKNECVKERQTVSVGLTSGRLSAEHFIVFFGKLIAGTAPAHSNSDATLLGGMAKCSVSTHTQPHTGSEERASLSAVSSVPSDNPSSARQAHRIVHSLCSPQSRVAGQSSAGAHTYATDTGNEANSEGGEKGGWKDSKVLAVCQMRR